MQKHIKKSLPVAVGVLLLSVSSSFASVTAYDFQLSVEYDDQADDPNTYYGVGWAKVKATGTAAAVEARAFVHKTSVTPQVEVANGTTAYQAPLNIEVLANVVTSRFVVEAESDYELADNRVWNDYGQWRLAGDGFAGFTTRTPGEDD